MNGAFLRAGRRSMLVLGALAALLGTAPLAAQVQSVDPDRAIDADLVKSAPRANAQLPATPVPAPVAPGAQPGTVSSGFLDNVPAAAAQAPAADAPAGVQSVPTQAPTYRKDDLIGAAEGVFGKGAQGLAGLIEDILSKQGEPNAYITGREGGAAFVVGVRYGSGTLFHKVEGELPVYWTGPSIGLDAGANAGNTFVLVYNLYDSADLYHRFGAGEGQAYLIGGFHVSYLRRGNVVLIPVRMGVGLRLGINAGYMKISRKQRWLPF